MSAQDITTLLEIDKKKVMPLYPIELLKYLLMIKSNEKTEINYKIIDCRLKKNNEYILGSYLVKKKVKVIINNILINDIKTKQFKFEKIIEDILKIPLDIHLCFLITNDENEEELKIVNKIIKELVKANRNYISYIEGGYEVFF